jgi:transcription elongation regulator 1
MTQQEFEEFSKQQLAPVEKMPQHLMDPTQQPMPSHLQFMPFNSGVPPFSMAPPFSSAPPPQWGNIQALIDPKIIAAAAQWTEHRAPPDGRPYFYNAATQQSIWEKPAALKELEEARMNAIRMQQQKMENKQQNEMEIEREKKRKEEQEKVKPQKPLDKSKPISSTPIAGTPWCVVWTGDAKVFFYCPSTKTSVWDRPEDLKGREDVDEALKNLPEQLRSEFGQTKNEVEKEKKEKVMPIQQHKEPQPMVEKSDDSNDDDTQEIPLKKPKIENESQQQNIQPIKVQEKKIDEISEAERKAAEERAKIPLETRITTFKEMLRENEVSAFSTFEKELRKIVQDPRYLLLLSKERKQVFEMYVRERAEEERREKRKKQQQKRDEFKELLHEAKLHTGSSFSNFSLKYSRDDRYRALEKMRDREECFNDYLDDLRRKGKKESKKKFFDFLTNSNIDFESSWSEVRRSMDYDLRNKIGSTDKQMEDWYNEHVKTLREEQRKLYVEKRVEKKIQKLKQKEDKTEGGDKEESEVDSETEAQAQREREKLDRITRGEMSIEKRRQEVKDTLTKTKEERDKERQHHKRDEAMRQLQALLTDLVRKSDMTWKDSKKVMKKDQRYNIVESLDRDTRHRLYDDHIENLKKKKRDSFREMLDEIPDITQDSTWKSIKDKVVNDPRFFRSYDNDQVSFKYFSQFHYKINKYFLSIG